jgi:hypothetical protein
VLLRREGYRQLLEMFVLIEAGLELPWESDAEDVYSPSLRNAAKLYEIWCYLTLVNVLGRVCGLQQIADAFTPSANGLSLLLKTGVNSAIRWHTTRRDRPIEIQLMYNRQFAARQESWTAAMHPDCSILIRPLALAPGTESLDVWVHFDAKYKIRSTPIIDRLPEEDDDEQPSRGSAKPEDLLKMHAYRDAIHRTAGAYVLYPGDVSLKHEQFSETLPGLGAFPLRPDGNETHGVEEIVKFLTGVLDHVADQATQHERERFWRARIRASPPPNYPTLSPAPFLDRPPADTDVLVGYVRGPRHRAWIERNRLYNVRADDRTGSLRLGGRELGARLVLLVGQPYFVT